jgi:hypothetical protein
MNNIPISILKYILTTVLILIRIDAWALERLTEVKIRPHSMRGIRPIWENINAAYDVLYTSSMPTGFMGVIHNNLSDNERRSNAVGVMPNTLQNKCLVNAINEGYVLMHINCMRPNKIQFEYTRDIVNSFYILKNESRKYVSFPFGGKIESLENNAGWFVISVSKINKQLLLLKLSQGTEQERQTSTYESLAREPAQMVAAGVPFIRPTHVSLNMTSDYTGRGAFYVISPSRPSNTGMFYAAGYEIDTPYSSGFLRNRILSNYMVDDNDNDDDNDNFVNHRIDRRCNYWDIEHVGGDDYTDRVFCVEGRVLKPNESNTLRNGLSPTLSVGAPLLYSLQLPKISIPPYANYVSHIMDTSVKNEPVWSPMSINIAVNPWKRYLSYLYGAAMDRGVLNFWTNWVNLIEINYTDQVLINDLDRLAYLPQRQYKTVMTGIYDSSMDESENFWRHPTAIDNPTLKPVNANNSTLADSQNYSLRYDRFYMFTINDLRLIYERTMNSNVDFNAYSAVFVNYNYAAPSARRLYIHHDKENVTTSVNGSVHLMAGEQEIVAHKQSIYTSPQLVVKINKNGVTNHGAKLTVYLDIKISSQDQVPRFKPAASVNLTLSNRIQDDYYVAFNVDKHSIYRVRLEPQPGYTKKTGIIMSLSLQGKEDYEKCSIGASKSNSFIYDFFLGNPHYETQKVLCKVDSSTNKVKSSEKLPLTRHLNAPSIPYRADDSVEISKLSHRNIVDGHTRVEFDPNKKGFVWVWRWQTMLPAENVICAKSKINCLVGDPPLFKPVKMMYNHSDGGWPKFIENNFPGEQAPNWNPTQSEFSHQEILGHRHLDQLWPIEIPPGYNAYVGVIANYKRYDSTSGAVLKGAWENQKLPFGNYKHIWKVNKEVAKWSGTVMRHHKLFLCLTKQGTAPKAGDAVFDGNNGCIVPDGWNNPVPKVHPFANPN